MYQEMFPLPCEDTGKMLHSLATFTTPNEMFEKAGATFPELKSGCKAKSCVSGFLSNALCNASPIALTLLIYHRYATEGGRHV